MSETLPKQQQAAPEPGQPPKKRSGSLFFYIIGILAVVLIIMWSTGACSQKQTRGTFTDFQRDIGYYTDNDGNVKFRTIPQIIVVEKDQDGQVISSFERDIPYNLIEAIVQQGNTFYILERVGTGDKTTAVKSFLNNPSANASYYFLHTAYYNAADILQAYNGEIGRIAVETVNLEEISYLRDGTKIVPKDTNNNVITDPLEREEAIRAKFAADFRIVFESQPVPSSWFNLTNILTILTLVFLGVLIYFIIRSYSGRGGALGNMGRNRATHTMGGAVRFSDVAGSDEEKEEVSEIVQFLRNPRKFLELGARIPKGVLLVGQPGTGKTLLAKAIAGEAGVNYFSISGSDFSEMLVGVGPSRMRDLFEQAKQHAPAIIFIDEIDSIARMRGVGVSGVSDENEQTLNQLLVQMDGFTKSEGVIVIAATNRPDVLDQALLRPGRFDRQIVVQMPDVKGREQILKVHAKGKPLGTDVDLKRVAQIVSGFSGADIENLLNEAAIIAAKKDKKKINMPDIQEGINKVLLGPQKRSRIITEEDKKITAFHEAGHAIVSRVLQPDQVVQEVSIIPRGMAAGYTLTNDKDDVSHHKSRKFLSAHLAMLMAGRVAEQLFIGDICTGSSNDLKVATNLAERMVTMFGMSDKLGPLYYGKEEEMALRLYNAQNPHSENLQSTIDSEIKVLIIAAEKAATDILKSHKSHADVMAQVLLERETIYADDIKLIMEGKNAKSVVLEMEKRDKTSREQEAKDKIDSELAVLERELEQMFQMSKSFVEAKLATPDKLDELKKNMELARDVIRKGGKLKQLPTLDNLETYANLVKESCKEVEPCDKLDDKAAGGSKPKAKTAARKPKTPEKK